MTTLIEAIDAVLERWDRFSRLTRSDNHDAVAIDTLRTARAALPKTEEAWYKWILDTQQQKRNEGPSHIDWHHYLAAALAASGATVPIDINAIADASGMSDDQRRVALNDADIRFVAGVLAYGGYLHPKRLRRILTRLEESEAQVATFTAQQDRMGDEIVALQGEIDEALARCAEIEKMFRIHACHLPYCACVHSSDRDECVCGLTEFAKTLHPEAGIEKEKP